MTAENPIVKMKCLARAIARGAFALSMLLPAAFAQTAAPTTGPVAVVQMQKYGLI